MHRRQIIPVPSYLRLQRFDPSFLLRAIPTLPWDHTPTRRSVNRNMPILCLRRHHAQRGISMVLGRACPPLVLRQIHATATWILFTHCMTRHMAHEALFAAVLILCSTSCNLLVPSAFESIRYSFLSLLCRRSSLRFMIPRLSFTHCF